MHEFIVDIEQADFNTRAGASNLLPGQKYRITDSNDKLVEAISTSTWKLLQNDPITIATGSYTCLPENVGRTHLITVSASITLPQTGIHEGDEFIFKDMEWSANIFVSESLGNIWYGSNISTISFTTPVPNQWVTYTFRYRETGGPPSGWILVDSEYIPLIYNPIAHTQGTDQALDTGGANEVTASQLKNHIQAQAILKTQVFS